MRTRCCVEQRRTCRRPISRRMTYPHDRDLAVNGVPVAVTCRGLKIARQPHYRWIAGPVTDAEPSTELEVITHPQRSHRFP
jgi:hypothetical protein